MDKVERSWEWRAPHDDRNIAVPIEVEPIGRGSTLPESRCQHGDRNEFRSTLCRKRAPRTTRRIGTKDNRHASPTGASMRSGRALARTSGVTPDDGRCRMSSLTDRRACRSPRRERDGDCGRPRRFNLYEKCYNSQSPSAPRQEAHTSLYSQSSSCPRSTCEGGTPSLQARDARRSACAAPVFQHALASRQAYQIVNSHTARS